MKIFLSHSSTDKAIVKRVYEELGAALCHYDEATFDPTGHIPEEIYVALNASTHFVLFASPAALQSSWVKGELWRAFENWMRTGHRRAMVFLLHGADVQDLPEWLRVYVMREPPTYRHILCRIQSEIDKESRNIWAPPFFRPNELQKIETKLLVEASDMPGGIFIHGPDGSGRKILINEIYSRHFPGVASRKLLLRAAAFTAERELYRDLVGLTTLASPSEFADIFQKFNSLSPEGQIQKLAETILECTKGNQCIVVESENYLLTEDGRIPEWLDHLLIELSGKDYPRIAFTTLRRPTHIPAKLLGKVIIQDTPDLDGTQSLILFNWWLRALAAPFALELKELVFEACSGNPKQLELGAKLLVQEGVGSTSKIRPHLIKNLEGLSRQFLDGLASDEIIAVVLAFVANAGYLTRSDLSQYLHDASISSYDTTDEAIAKCLAFGFLVEDEVCIRMPDYLIRGARAIGRSSATAQKLAELWKLQAASSASIKIDEVTSIAVLNEHCLATLRSGNNIGAAFESIILPSQCIQVARTMYENEDYKNTFNLCLRAYESRAALSTDGLIEALRYMGLSAARLGDQNAFRETIRKFLDLRESGKATRISHFLQGFNERLEGNYDGALNQLNIAHKIRGEQDIHILRELAFINLHIGEIPTARIHVQSALSRAKSNHYVLELAVRIELVGDASTVAKRAVEIETLLEKLHAFDTSPDKIYWLHAKCEYELALNEFDAANATLTLLQHSGGNSPASDILRARLLVKRKSYNEAVNILQKLHQKISTQKTGQRKSILPIISRLLIDSAAASSPATGVDWFIKCESQLPAKTRAICARQLLDSLPFTKATIPESSRQLLSNAARR